MGEPFGEMIYEDGDLYLVFWDTNGNKIRLKPDSQFWQYILEMLPKRIEVEDKKKAAGYIRQLLMERIYSMMRKEDEDGLIVGWYDTPWIAKYQIEIKEENNEKTGSNGKKDEEAKA